MSLDTLVEILAPFPAKLQSDQSGLRLSYYLGTFVWNNGDTNCITIENRLFSVLEGHHVRRGHQNHSPAIIFHPRGGAVVVPRRW